MARLVIAFGGNALIREDERGTWPEQTVHALEAARAIARMGRADEVVLTHGNGPQVGALALQQAIGEPHAPALPLDVLDAMTQGEIGYLLQQALTAVDPSLPTATVLTRVLVADDDPAFAAEPTKPIGAFLAEDEARRVARERGWHVAPDAGRGWRRMVPSPRPLRILEVDHVRRWPRAGCSSSPPAAAASRWLARRAPRRARRRRRQGPLRGRAGRVAAGRHARAVTSVPRVEIGFGTPASRVALRLTVSDALHHLERGRVPARQHGAQDRGRRALRGRGRSAVITDAAHLATAVRGHHGTWIVPDDDGPSVFAPAPVAA